MPQRPQLALSVFVATHEPAQAWRPGRQPAEQAPAEHACGAAQCTPQAPQLFGSTLVGMQMPLQSVWSACWAARAWIDSARARGDFYFGPAPAMTAAETDAAAARL